MGRDKENTATEEEEGQQSGNVSARRPKRYSPASDHHAAPLSEIGRMLRMLSSSGLHC